MSADQQPEMVPVGSIGEVRMGKQLSPAARAAGEQMPYLRVANVFDGTIDYSDVKSMGFSAAERERYLLYPGDILLNEGQESLAMVGRSAIFDGPPDTYCFQNTLIRFRPSAQVLPKYAQLVFSHWRRNGVFARTAEKTSISHLGGSRFAALPFPLVPLDQQRSTVEAIDSVEATERGIKASIAKLRGIQSATTSELLHRFGWETSIGAVLLSLRNGYSPNETQQWSGVQMLGLGCLTPDGYSPRQLKNAPSFVSPSHAARLAEGDLLMSRANTRDLVGLAGIYRDSTGTPRIYPDLMMRLQPKPCVRAEFLELCLRSPRARRKIMAMAQGTSESMVKISSASVKALKIPLPPIQVQDEVLTVAHRFNERIGFERSELAKLRTLRQGLADDLLSGRVSVRSLG